MSDRLIVPTIDRYQAYELYRQLSPRSITLLSEKTGIPRGTLLSWSSQDRWQDAIKRHQQEMALAIREQADLWLIGTLPSTIREIDAIIADKESTYEVIEGIPVCTHQAAPAVVRAKLLMWKADRAGVSVVAQLDALEQDTDAESPNYEGMSARELAKLVQQSRERRSG